MSCIQTTIAAIKTIIAYSTIQDPDEKIPGKGLPQERTARVKMYIIITISYLVFWGPLFLETLIKWGWMWEEAKSSISHEVSSSCNIISKRKPVRPIV